MPCAVPMLAEVNDTCESCSDQGISEEANAAHCGVLSLPLSPVQLCPVAALCHNSHGTEVH